MTDQVKRDLRFVVFITIGTIAFCSLVAGFQNTGTRPSFDIRTKAPTVTQALPRTVATEPTTTTVKPAPPPTAPVTTTTTSPPVTAPPVTIPQPVAASTDYHTFYDWPLWRALGRCEEGVGPPPDGILWSKNSSYVSGFGMLRSTFNYDARAIGLPDYHEGYPIVDQIRVAREGHYVRDQYWGCGKSVPGW